MAIDPKEADVDLIAKTRLERQILPFIRSADRDISRRVVQSLGSNGSLPDVASMSAIQYEALLTQHFDSVGNTFGRTVRDQLPEGAESTIREDAEIAGILLALRIARSNEQAAKMGKTNERDAIFALNIAQDEELQGTGLSRQEIALIAGVGLLRKLRGREARRAGFETQAFAEQVKSTEVEALVKGNVIPQKQWVTMGDDKVRPAHSAANGQTVDYNVPFTVGGEQLNKPGDTSLGATLENVIECRCSSVIDVDAIALARLQ